MPLPITKSSDQEYSWGKIVLMGAFGSGKTYSIGTLPESETIVLNILQESGMRTIRHKTFDILNIRGVADFKEAIKDLGTDAYKQKYKYVAVDSYSQFNKYLEAELTAQGYTGFKLWGLIKSITKELVDDLKKLPYHVVFTCEVKAEKEESTGEIVFLPSLAGAAKDDLPGWVDEVYFLGKFGKVGENPSYQLLTRSGSKYPCKTRSNDKNGQPILPVKIENPNLFEIFKLISDPTVVHKTVVETSSGAAAASSASAAVAVSSALAKIK